MEHAIIATPIGLLELKASSDGLSSVLFIETDALPTTIIPKVLDDAVAQLLEYFAGERTTFSLKLDPSGTDFQRRVWRELEAIPFGKTTSYLAMAKQLGDPKVIRAAASANGKNPISIIIPCHRVIGSDGSLTGYAGGLHRKKWLLEHESPVTQGSLF
ncbi:methylated-DNA-[protein]-cysteine S-methyltransferase [Dokdonia sp. Hel_I_63]|jgi:methylated-DNA-[protein]-cysteine S-methyltransferase|uniref:methylated-DNA--[protein]-cysteine S-methyltransferase n=1 Tax=unclassified Dokdonia TaxID=2615033 RepID=UPI00020A6BAB|nr:MULTISPECIES: methylated-DNA--[protein]-cysteine S-methyltransferase [unclassified Dokdonia]AEE19044.1 methylated-DNA/protein-cysteine methyltransferase [Dokdonia sp. 4H-3-7-5]TVZ21724.1 methylated-DNA-[protein]-cysteine S-methyltransferase [Dokdonia sp. Hel_I_63]